MLLAAAMRAPSDRSEAAKQVWDVYYGNHQANKVFKHLKVADIFMGGGTTIVEGSRLGMQMYGNDLNPIAWFVVKNELAQVDKTEVEALLADIEAEVKPQIMPFCACDCPRGHKGKWTKRSTGEVMGDDFDPPHLLPKERNDYSYEGPEIIYAFWAKHGPCQVTGCDHRTPIMTSPVMAMKTISVKYWVHKCRHCGGEYDLEEREARMAPGVPLIMAETERPNAAGNLNNWIESAVCPLCGKEEKLGIRSNPQKKKIELTLLVHPEWLQGEPGYDADGREYGGSADDSVEATIRWNKVRAAKSRLIEVRGKLPDELACPETGVIFRTGKDGGTVPTKSNFVCMAETCGRKQGVRQSVMASGKNGPVAMYAIQGYCPECDKEGQLFGGRFFAPATDSRGYDAATIDWEHRKNRDLAGYWPTSKVPDGLKVRELHNYLYTHWWKLFNYRQLLIHSALLKAISHRIDSDVGEYVLGAFQQYLRNQNMFCFWNMQRALEPFFSNHNYHPKATTVENSVFSGFGRGDWISCTRFLNEARDWGDMPWEIVSKSNSVLSDVAKHVKISSVKVRTGDPLHKVGPYGALSTSPVIHCGSSTDLASLKAEHFDAVITDPPFEGNIQYSELSEFFYVWIRLALKDKYPRLFSKDYTPKALEAVANSVRHEDQNEHYQRLLTECYREASRILKPGGIFVFTFHHHADDAWVSVLESLFDAGFYLAATYPIRSDETKGDKAQFGSQKIEYDIIHVCRKRHEKPTPISWAKLRRQVLRDVRELKDLLENHSEDGLPEADLQVIRRGKALEYFSRHYGKVYKDEGVPINVLEALVGINQLLDEEARGIKEPPPHNAEPFTRMFLRLFDGKAELARDQMQKFLRGTGSAPSDFVNRGWCLEKKKIFNLTPPLEIAFAWIGKHRKSMTSDYDQSMFLIGACFENSGINATDTLKNPNFRPHPALGAILTWQKTHGATTQIRNASTLALQLYRNWEAKNQIKVEQLKLFDHLGEEYH